MKKEDEFQVKIKGQIMEKKTVEKEAKVENNGQKMEIAINDVKMAPEEKMNVMRVNQTTDKCNMNGDLVKENNSNRSLKSESKSNLKGESKNTRQEKKAEDKNNISSAILNMGEMLSLTATQTTSTNSTDSNSQTTQKSDSHVKMASQIDIPSQMTEMTKEMPRANKSSLYGAVQMLTQINEAVVKVDKGTKPVIQLCHQQNQDKQPPVRMREKKFDRQLSMPARLSVPLVSRQESLSEEEEQFRRDYAWIPEKRSDKKDNRKCRKHSKCHCYLFSLDTVGFYALTS